MKLNWICGVLFAIALTIPASAQVSVYIGSAPPPLRYEQRGPIPGPGYVWVEGYWARMGITTGGWRGVGSVRPTKGRIGAILTTIITGKAGGCMKATGIMRITTEIADTTTITTIIS